VDAKDMIGKWYESTILAVKDSEVFVHYEGWSSAWDEWLDVSGERLAAFRTMSEGAQAR
jgi:hypothetical protein